MVLFAEVSMITEPPPSSDYMREECPPREVPALRSSLRFRAKIKEELVQVLSLGGSFRDASR
jgi:hypothetical protein